MSTMKAVLSVIFLLGVLHGAVGFLCYSRGIGSDYTGVTFCPSGSCYSVGGSFFGATDSKKGCADKKYPFGCQEVGLPGFIAEHTCFCNSFLCNSSSMPPVFIPLLLLPYLLQKLL
ncbi:hypothetical protein OTU49_004083 [Cherax quadricarinatus]|uniref:UPAR/Ly6 domain-containing protein n=1 Tax=Cherax quadricarinatus TaxID=27406 RepID=A0AAW0XFR2_CHEQU